MSSPEDRNPDDASDRLTNSIRVAIAGVGNCASSLVQGVGYYRAHPDDAVGLMHHDLGGYRVGQIRFVAAFDIDARKVGRPLSEAIFALPNNTKVFFDPRLNAGSAGSTGGVGSKGEAVSAIDPIDPIDPIVRMGPVLDGLPGHMADYPSDARFEASSESAADVAGVLRESGAQVLVNYMPVGAQRATEFYAGACLEAGVAFVNCVPCFVVSDANWAARFERRGLPCVGDDIKAQLGATITHRMLARLCEDRGVRITSTYQLNTAGNTDFLNMLARDRLGSKRASKTQAVQSQLLRPLDPDQIHIGPSDYVPFLKDNKVCYLRIEGTGFGGLPLNLDLRLSVEDSPNSAAVVVDAIRACQLAREASVAGAIESACAWTMKHPPKQMTDLQALLELREFVKGCIKVGRG
jgi:myo-inositol-1-phosphate synthase